MKRSAWLQIVRTVVPYFLAASSLICAGIIAYFLRHDHDRTKGAYLAGLTAASITFVTAIYQQIRERETSEQNAKLLELQLQNRRLVEGLQGNLTGSESFAAIYFPVVNGRHVMVIRQFGPNPLTNIRIALLTGVPPKIIDSLVYPALPIYAVENVKPFNLTVEKRFAMQAMFETLNDSWNETIICANVDGEVIFAINVWRSKAGDDGYALKEVLLEQIHPKFPRDQAGNIDMSMGTMDISGSTRVLESPEEQLDKKLGVR